MADEEEGGGGGKKKLIIIVVLLLLLLGGGAAAYFQFMAPVDEEGTADGQPKIEEEAENITQKDVTKLSNPQYTPPKEYNVNLRDGKHFLRVEMVAVLEDEDALFYLSKREPIIDDMVITLLGNQTTESLKTSKGRQMLKNELLRMVNSVYTREFIEESETQDPTPVKKILMTKFILQ